MDTLNEIQLLIIGTPKDAEAGLPHDELLNKFGIKTYKMSADDEAYKKLFYEGADVIAIYETLQKQKILEFIKTVRVLNGNNNAPILIISSGNGDTENEIEYYQGGAQVYLKPPIEVGKFIAMVANFIHFAEAKSQISTTVDLPDNSASNQPNTMLKVFIKVILKGIDQETGMDDICKELNMSRRTLYRKTKLFFDSTPSELLSEIRIDYAKKLLTGQQFSIKTISYMVGFSSPQYFNHVFKKVTGKTPLAYCENHVR